MGLKLIYYYAIIAILLAVSFLVGYFFHSFIKPKQKKPLTLFSLFANFVIGLVILISAYSIIITSGKTVSWIYILLLVGYGYFLTLNTTIDYTPIISGRYLKLGLSLLVLSAILYLIYLSSLLDFKLLRFTDTFCDWQYYSKTSQYLNLGFESTGQFDNIAFGGTFTPYHYFEIWVAALVTKIFAIPSQIATSIIMPSVLGCISYIGILGFATIFNKKTAILAFLLLFISSVTFFSTLLNKVGFCLPLVAGDISSVVSYFKLYPILIFLVLSLHYTLQKNFLLSFCSLLFIPVASFVLAPSILAFSWILIVYLFYKNVDNSNNLRFAFFLTIYTTLYICYYLFFWDTQSLNNVISFQELWVQIYSLFDPLLLIFKILPFLLFILLFKKHVCLDSDTKNKIIFSYFLLLLLSIGIVSITISNYDGIQFFTNLFIPLSTALISLFLLRMELSNGRSNLIAYILFMLLLLSSMFYSVKYIFVQEQKKHELIFTQQIIEILTPLNTKVIYCGFLHSQQYYSQYHMRSISKVFRACEVIDSYYNNLLEVGMSDYVALDWFQNKYKGEDVPKKQGLSRIPEGTFYKFVELQKKEGKFNSIECSQINFIDKFKIDYIFIQNDASISAELSRRIILLAAEKEREGYSFYKISR